MSESYFEEKWEHFFKPETRSSGRSYFNKGVVSISRPSDNQIQAYIRTSSSFKVTFKSESIESNVVSVNCTCPQSKKGQLCKHIWASLLKIEERFPDFLETRKQIENQAGSSPVAGSVRTMRPPTQSQIDLQETYKKKQADYRKEQYQKQKLRQKTQKASKKKSSSSNHTPEFPTDVERALTFFDSNGFHMERPLNAEVVGMAKKRLSRVFHPDIGGSHGEILELNKNYEIIINYLKSESKKS